MTHSKFKSQSRNKKHSISAESGLLQHISKEVVFGNNRQNVLKKTASDKVNWQKLQDLLLYHELAPFLYIVIKNDPEAVPAQFFKFLEYVYYKQVFRYIYLSEELTKIIELAAQNHLLLLPIKGFSMSDVYYKRYGFRPLVDIDLLVKEGALDKGMLILESLGYKKYFKRGKEEYWRKKQCHLEFKKDIRGELFSVDLHWALDFKRRKEGVLPSLWERIREINIGGKKIPSLSLEDTIFSIILHQRRFGKTLNLKYVCDLGLILNGTPVLDWDYIFKAAREENFNSCLFFLLAQVQTVLDINLEKYIRELKIPYWKRKCAFEFINKYSYLSHKDFDVYYLFLLSHFLLYDNTKEPIKYILNIPEEQFAKFYKLPLFKPNTKRLYKIRFLYMFYRLLKDRLIRRFLPRLPR
ncbi:MAG: nucleotidyltransferase family protein [Candidatus Omnitrophota bacterium]